MLKIFSFVLLIILINTLIIYSEDATGNKVIIDSHTFGRLNARSIGPAVMGGRISTLDVVLKNPRIIYVGAASGGVWKSVTGGITFEPIFDKHTQSIGSLTIDQSSPDTVWVGTGETWVRNSVSVGTGLYKTTDGGKNWKLMGLEDSERISRILINPKNSDIVYVACMGHLWNANRNRGVYKTKDSGRTWKKIFYINENTGCADLAMDPQNPDIIYAAMWEFRRRPYSFYSGGPGSGLFKTADGGKNWKRIQKNFPPENLGRIALATATSRTGLVYALVESKRTTLYRSESFGENWIPVNSSRSIGGRPFYFSLILVDPTDPSRIYKPGYKLYVSSNGGRTFMPRGRSVHADLHAMWINPKNPLNLILGTDGGIYVSHDRGNTWRILNNLPLSVNIYRLQERRNLLWSFYSAHKRAQKIL